MQLEFLSIHRYIFESQLAFLTFANDQRGPISASVAEPWLASGRKALSTADLSFDDWARFLVFHNLMSRPDDEHVQITVKGVEFLAFLTRSGLPLGFKLRPL